MTFRRAAAEDLPPDHPYDLILTLDCLHDMPRPAKPSPPSGGPSAPTGRG